MAPIPLMKRLTGGITGGLSAFASAPEFNADGSSTPQPQLPYTIAPQPAQGGQQQPAAPGSLRDILQRIGNGVGRVGGQP